MTPPVSATELVAFVHADLTGLTRGRAFPQRDLDRRLRTGVGWVPANQAMTPLDGLAEPNPWGPLGDVRLRADPATEVRVVVAGQDAPLHFFLCDATTLDGAAWEACPRGLLKRAIAAFESETATRLTVAFEQEFTLRAASLGAVAAPGFSLEALRVSEPFASRLMRVLDDAGISVETFLPEVGPYQYELSTAPTGALQAADDAVRAREITRDVARSVDGRATFTPIIAADQAANGVHIHVSFETVDGSPVGHDRDRPAGLSVLAGQFAAGVIEHLAGLCAFTAPSPVSYVRLAPHRWSAGFGFVGASNREAALRIPSLPSVDAARHFNLEYRAADAAACPHFALAMLIYAGLDGVRRGLACEPVIAHDPDELDAAARRSAATTIPRSLADALAAAERDHALTTSLPQQLSDAYFAAKRLEIDTVRNDPPTEMFARYARVY
jgi:glutamine synthetase